MFCAPRLVFSCTEGVGSHLHVLRTQTRFRRCRGRRVPVSCFARPDSFSAVTSVSGPVFIFCVPGLFFGGTESVVSRFYILRARSLFRPYRGRHDLFSCFALTDSFLAVPRALAPVFMLCAPELIFDGVECVRSPFLFCASGLVFGSTEDVESRFHVLRALTRFRLYRWCRLPFTCFVLSDSFSPVPMASSPIFKICAPGLIFGCTECVESRFHVLQARTRFRRYRGRRVTFSSFARPDSFSPLTRASGPFSCFSCPNSFSAVPRASVLVFMFCAPGPVFGGAEGVVYRFHALTRFRRC
jgi:hypothetical protein